MASIVLFALFALPQPLQLPPAFPFSSTLSSLPLLPESTKLTSTFTTTSFLLGSSHLVLFLSILSSLSSFFLLLFAIASNLKTPDQVNVSELVWAHTHSCYFFFFGLKVFVGPVFARVGLGVATLLSSSIVSSVAASSQPVIGQLSVMSPAVEVIANAIARTITRTSTSGGGYGSDQVPGQLVIVPGRVREHGCRVRLKDLALILNGNKVFHHWLGLSFTLEGSKRVDPTAQGGGQRYAIDSHVCP